MKFIKKETTHVSSLSQVYAEIHLFPNGPRIVNVTEDGFASLQEATTHECRVLHVRSPKHLAYVLSRLETSRGGLAVFFNDGEAA